MSLKLQNKTTGVIEEPTQIRIANKLVKLIKINGKRVWGIIDRLLKYKLFGNSEIVDNNLLGVGEAACVTQIFSPEENKDKDVASEHQKFTDGYYEIETISTRTTAGNIAIGTYTPRRSHKYLFFLHADEWSAGNIFIYASSQQTWNLSKTNNVSFVTMSDTLTESSMTVSFRFRSGTFNAGGKWSFYLNIIDLTRLFGIGNEPNTLEEVKEQLYKYGIIDSVEGNDLPKIKYGVYNLRARLPIVVTKGSQQETHIITCGGSLNKINDNLCDELDYENGTITRKTKRIVYDGGENCKYGGSTRTSVYHVISDIKTNGNYKVLNAIGNISLYAYHRAHAIHFLDTGFSDIYAFKAELRQKYIDGNPVTVIYELDTPTIEELQLPDIYGDDDTIISTDTPVQPSNIIIE